VPSIHSERHTWLAWWRAVCRRFCIQQKIFCLWVPKTMYIYIVYISRWCNTVLWKLREFWTVVCSHRIASFQSFFSAKICLIWCYIYALFAVNTSFSGNNPRITVSCQSFVLIPNIIAWHHICDSCLQCGCFVAFLHSMQMSWPSFKLFVRFLSVVTSSKCTAKLRDDLFFYISSRFSELFHDPFLSHILSYVPPA
jgi:hypothetical protein